MLIIEPKEWQGKQYPEWMLEKMQEDDRAYNFDSDWNDQYES